ncbi:MAG: hypothetical protein Q7J80_10355 [Anaerolineales bacterium]|nr:hypothetical protein [Anaerolineales bacterium]
MHASLNDRAVRTAHFAELTLLAVVVVLIVFKPFQWERSGKLGVEIRLNL